MTDLADGEFVVVAEPAPPRAPARGLLRRRPAPPPVRYAQVRRGGDHFYTECVGASRFGGDWDVSKGQHQRLRDLGWLTPDDPDPAGVKPGYPNYWALLPHHQADAVVGM